MLMPGYCLEKWRNCVRDLRANGVTILLTTHYLQEAEELCDRIAIIHKGQIVANEEKETLLGRIEGKEVKFILDREIASIPPSLQGWSPEQEGKRTIRGNHPLLNAALYCFIKQAERLERIFGADRSRTKAREDAAIIGS